jgi:hypothetical protein
MGAACRYEIKFEPKIIAEIRLLRSDEGGRSGPVRSGYRRSHDFGDVYEGAPNLNDTAHDFEGDTSLQLGERRRSRMRFISPELQFGRLFEGFRLTLHERTKLVGHGTVVAIVDSRMKKNNGALS